MSSIHSQTSSLIAKRVNALSQVGLAKSLAKLSTGFKINRGADNPAGLISSENLKAALVALEAESRSIQRADSVASVADGALGEASNLLIEARGLAVANANSAGLSDGEREANQLQIDSALASVDRIARSTTFNGNRLLDGSASLTVSGATLDIESAATGSVGGVDIDGEGYTVADVASGGALNTVSGDVGGAVAAIDAAISDIVNLRGKIGSFQKDTLATSLNSNSVAIENIAAANSVIRDTDYAAETANLARAKALSFSSMSILELANHSAKNVLDLLG